MARGKDSGGAKAQAGAGERILRALASEFPKLHDRQSLLESPSMQGWFEAEGAAGMRDNDRQAAAKAIGRLVVEGSVAEVLWPRGTSPKVQLPEQGMIAVSVDLGSMREGRLAWEEHREGKPPSQERIVDEIVDRSRTWIEENSEDGKLVLLLTNVSIIHGSNAFDILITASYRTPYELLRYTREVVQVVDHVAGTHTMLVAQSYGFPHFNGGR